MSKAFFKSLFLIGCWILVNLALALIEPYVSAIQNGMPLQNRIKIERFIAKILESVDFDQFLGKTLRGYLGHLKPFNFRMNGIFGWPWVGSIQFCGQNQNPRSDHDKYQIKSLSQAIVAAVRHLAAALETTRQNPQRHVLSCSHEHRLNSNQRSFGALCGDDPRDRVSHVTSRYDPD